MKVLLLTTTVLLSSGVQAESWTLSADSWARPRDGGSVATMAPLPEVIRHWEADAGRALVIRYPGGEEGQLWALELRSWLVALGVPQDSQELVAGSDRADRIEIVLSR